MKLIEDKFSTWDRDDAGMLMFRAVEAGLASAAFVNREALHRVWREVDMDRNGTLDFVEFLCLVFLWPTMGSYRDFFSKEENERTVSNAFIILEETFKQYEL
eukprot:758536-Hanusia_phi.AAC.2